MSRRPLIALVALVTGGCITDFDAAMFGDTETLLPVEEISGDAIPNTPHPSNMLTFVDDDLATPAAPPTTEPATPHSEPSSDAHRPETARLAGVVTGEGEYVVFDIGSAARGELLRFSRPASERGHFTLAIFDGNWDLLTRSSVLAGGSIGHILREDAQVFAAVTPGLGAGGDFVFHLQAERAAYVPAPRSQLVYLDFRGASNVSVSYRRDLSFPAFEGAFVGAAYARATQRLKDIVVEQMRSDYAEYDVEILTSDDGPPPAASHAVLYFGGDGVGLLGLADNVDRYNAVDAQKAIIFVNTFATYQVMGLTTEEMGQMLANTASHELGHLLGLYHTADPSDVMDTTAGAWELTDNQQFQRAVLESRVFPTGFENCPKLLRQTVGVRKGAAQAQHMTTTDPVDVAVARTLLAKDLPHLCGTCQHIDE